MRLPQRSYCRPWIQAYVGTYSYRPRAGWTGMSWMAAGAISPRLATFPAIHPPWRWIPPADCWRLPACAGHSVRPVTNISIESISIFDLSGRWIETPLAFQPGQYLSENCRGWFRILRVSVGVAYPKGRSRASQNAVLLYIFRLD